VSPAARGAGEGPARGGAELQLGGEARDGGGRGAATGVSPQKDIRLTFASGCWRAQVFVCVRARDLNQRMGLAAFPLLEIVS
jgi:hypothetical protein